MTKKSPIIAVLDIVFKAVACGSRRLLLDALFQKDGQTLTELASALSMTRFGVMKHLRVLEAAGLVATLRRGREKFHYLNPVPIQVAYDRWVGKYRVRRARSLFEIKTALEAE